MENEEFKKDLDELVRLFTRLKDKAKSEEAYGFDKNYLQNLEMFINSYNMAKGGMTEGMMDQLGKMGQPMRDMIRQMIDQLKDELGEDNNDIISGIEEKANETKKLEENTKVEIVPTRSEIDRMLKLPGLSEKEINDLLDQRAKAIE